MTVPYNPLEGPRPELTIDLRDGSDEQISIIVVHKDHPEYLSMCLQSIAVTSFNSNYEIIVVDNGSGKESQDFLEEIKDEVKLIRNEKNLYWSAAANKGAAAADRHSKYLVFLHCDVVITNSAWLDLLINACESHNSGMVGVEFQSYMLGTQKTDFLADHITMFSRECWKDCGGWPEKLPQIGMNFILTMKAHARGYKPQVLKNPIAHHYRIFSLNINEYEVLTENAMMEIPKLISDIRTEEVKIRQ